MFRDILWITVIHRQSKPCLEVIISALFLCFYRLDYVDPLHLFIIRDTIYLSLNLPDRYNHRVAYMSIDTVSENNPSTTGAVPSKCNALWDHCQWQTKCVFLQAVQSIAFLLKLVCACEKEMMYRGNDHVKTDTDVSRILRHHVAFLLPTISLSP